MELTTAQVKETSTAYLLINALESHRASCNAALAVFNLAAILYLDKPLETEIGNMAPKSVS